MIKTQIAAHSKTKYGMIVTFIVTFPRYILAELNTHRMFSRNSASSRAIPFNKMLKSVWNNPFIPLAWQKDHSGMQGTEYFTDSVKLFLLRNLWLFARTLAIILAWTLSKLGLTKQLCNRILEPFMWHTAIITATELENFFHLRCPQYSLFNENMPMEFRSRKDFLKFVNHVEAPEFKNQYDTLPEIDWHKINKGQADIHIMALAETMWDALNESTPKELKEGEWHIPFGDNIDDEELYWEVIKSKFPASEYSHGEKDYLLDEAKIKIATARCARVSYTVVGEEGKKDNYKNDFNLHDRLAKSGHWSPFEHCAQSLTEQEFYNINNGILVETMNGPFSDYSGNLKGFKQYRKMFKNENIK